MSISNRIIQARQDKNLTQTDLAKALETRQSTVSSWEQGARKPGRRNMKQLAIALDVSIIWLEHGDKLQAGDTHDTQQTQSRHVPLVGDVGAGGHIMLADDQDNLGGFEFVDAPPECGDGTVAARIKGDSHYPFLKDGALIYYSLRQDNVLDFLHEMVIVHLMDGRKAIKVLTPGTEPGLFTLTSTNAPPMLNQHVESVSPIDWIRP